MEQLVLFPTYVHMEAVVKTATGEDHVIRLQGAPATTAYINLWLALQNARAK